MHVILKAFGVSTAHPLQRLSEFAFVKLGGLALWCMSGAYLG